MSRRLNRSGGTSETPEDQPIGQALRPEVARRQGGSFVILRTAQQAIGLITAIVIARSLSPAQRAQYALPLALAGLVWAGSHLSLDSAAGRLLGRREAKPEEVASCLAGAGSYLG